MNLPSRIVLWAMTFILCFGIGLAWFSYQSLAEITANDAAIEQAQAEMDDMHLTKRRLDRQQLLEAEQTAALETQEQTEPPAVDN